jgi:hypothetical protein
LGALVSRFSTSTDVAAGLNDKLTAAAAVPNAKARSNILDAFDNQANAQAGKALTTDQAQVLISLSNALR